MEDDGEDAENREGIGNHADDAGIEDFRRELAHPFDAGVDVGNDFGHQGTRIGLLHVPLRRLDQVLVEPVFHGKADVVGELPDVQALDIAGALDAEDDQGVTETEGVHIRCRPGTAENIIEVLGQLPVEPGAGNHADIV